MGTQLPPEKGTPTPIQFLAHVYCGQTAGWIKMLLGTEVNVGPGNVALDGVVGPPKRGTAPPPQFSVHVYCGQTAVWIKTPLGTEVDIGTAHIVLDEVPALHERGTAAPLLSAHVCCGHSHPSELLLSSCFNMQPWL